MRHLKASALLLITPTLIGIGLGFGVPAAIFAQSTGPATAAAPGLGFYRFPALHGDTIVFAAEGDLWLVTTQGGVAQRLTTHPAEETDPLISPDGQTLAFTASYEGPAELYTMPIGGGLPVRHTYETEYSTATTWSPDGQLIYATQHYATLPVPQLVSLDLASGARARFPLETASEGNLDASGRTLFFVRPAFHRNVTKRYTGGTARKIWKYTEGTEEAVPLTSDYRGESHSPMWWNGRVFFVTDRDGTMNLWSMDENGGDLRQHTHHSGWDVKDPSLSEGRIVYALGADLWLYNIAMDRAGLIPITLASDFDQLRDKWVKDPMRYLTSAHLSPTGDRVVLTARGRVFVAPAGNGRLVRASRQPGVRYRDVVFLPDGESLLGLSDESEELEFVRIPANGIGPTRPLTADGTVLRFQGHPSPDGRWVAYDDRNNDLWVLDTENGKSRKISLNREGIGDMAWSPDGRWLAFSMAATNTFRQIQLYDTESGTTAPITSDRVNSFAIAWDPSGDFLYFLSDRNLHSLVGSPWGPRAPEPYFDRSIDIFHISLRKGERSPFKPDDELHHATADAAGADGAESAERASGTAATVPVDIELDGIQRRITRVPVPAGNYGDLAITDAALFWSSRDSGPNARSHLMGVKIGNEKLEPKKVVEGIRSFELSGNGKKLLVRKGQKLYIIDAKPQPAKELGEHTVDLDGWRFPIDVREDWRQVFVDAWRLERDYFYDPGMHGVDWEAVRDKYLPLVDRVTTRNELSDLIGRVIGELSALHTSVRGGDLRAGPDSVRVATLGARLARDPEAGGYRIEHIYLSDPDYPEERSPLADPELDVHEGDVIEAVNGVATLQVPDIGALLRNQEGRQVLLRVRSSGGSQADAAGNGARNGGTRVRGGARSPESRDLIVVPTANEWSLRYSDWEYTRRLRVEERGGGRLGYVHLRAMGSNDITTWYRNFYPVFDRPGLIVDVRRNRGGNIDSFILDKLARKAWMYWKSRDERSTWNMQYAFRGHMVVLVDQNTASDGEAFAEGFRRLGLGQVIGARTWGGEIWLSSVNRLSDGGLARAPMSGVYGPEGEWLIEQTGVIPDIQVINLPHATFLGDDAQLDAAIETLLEEIRKDPRAVPEPPPYPNKSFAYPRVSVGDSSGGGR